MTHENNSQQGAKESPAKCMVLLNPQIGKFALSILLEATEPDKADAEAQCVLDALNFLNEHGETILKADGIKAVKSEWNDQLRALLTRQPK